MPPAARELPAIHPGTFGHAAAVVAERAELAGASAGDVEEIRARGRAQDEALSRAPGAR